MARTRKAVCPSCGASVTVTYWPFNIPLYTVHTRGGSNRDCPSSLRPLAPGDGEDLGVAPSPTR